MDVDMEDGKDVAAEIIDEAGLQALLDTLRERGRTLLAPRCAMERSSMTRSRRSAIFRIDAATSRRVAVIV
jgi:hypothetical protein